MNRTTVTKKTNKNSRFRSGMTLPIVVLCLFIVFVIVGVGSSAWNIHLRMDSNEISNPPMTTGEDANRQLLKYIDPVTPETLTITDENGQGATYPVFTYDKNKHSPELKSTIADDSSGDDPARELPIEWFDVSYSKIADPNPSARHANGKGDWKNWKDPQNEQKLNDVPVSAGIYRYTVKANDNAGKYKDYLGEASMIFVIVPRRADIWIVADKSIYGSEHNPNVIFEGDEAFLDNDFSDLKDEHTLLSFRFKDSIAAASENANLITRLEKTAQAGDYEIEAQDESSNYLIIYKYGKVDANKKIVETDEDVVFTIEKRDITIEFNLVNKLSKVYGDGVNENLFYQQIVIKETNGNVVFEYKNGEFNNSIWNTENLSPIEAIKSVITLTSPISKASSVGNYEIKPELKDENNYNVIGGIESRGVFEVTKATLTMTAVDVSVVYGESAEFSVSYEGFVNDENENVLSRTPTFNCDYEVGDFAGRIFVITPNLEEQQNYEIIVQSGTLTVVKRAITVELKSSTSVYGDDIPEGILQADVTSGSIYGEDKPYVLSTTANKTSSVGSYPVSATATNNNYEITFVNNGADLHTITKATLVIRANDKKIEYGDDVPEFTFTVSGLKNDDELEVSATCDYVPGKKVGTYVITPSSSGVSSNYIVSIVTGTLTVEQRTVVISWEGDEFIYNGFEQAPTAKILNLFGNDVCEVVVEGAKINAGKDYTARAVSLNNQNYKLPRTSLTRDFSILPKEVSLTWTKTSLTYNGKQQTPTVTVEGLCGTDVCTVTGIAVLETGEKAGIDVGTYTAKVLGLSNSRDYKLPEVVEKSFKIVQKEATLVWIDTEFVYDGTVHTPTATISNLVAADKDLDIIVTVDGGQIKVGKFTATAVSISNGNYKVSATASKKQTQFTISPKTAILEWIGPFTFAYDETLTTPHIPTARVSNLVGEDQCDVTVEIQTGDCLSRGSHVVFAVKLSNENYELPADNTQEIFIGDYVYIPELNVDGDVYPYIFNGQSQTYVWKNGTFDPNLIEVISIKNSDTSDTKDYLTNLPTNAGTYIITVALVDTALSTWTDGTKTEKTITWVIRPRAVSLTWSNLELFYNTFEQLPTATYVDVFGQKVEASVKSNKTSIVPDSTYIATATINDPNYSVEGSNEMGFKISKLRVKLSTDLIEESYVDGGIVVKDLFLGKFALVDNLEGDYLAALNDAYNAIKTATAKNFDEGSANATQGRYSYSLTGKIVAGSTYRIEIAFNTSATTYYTLVGAKTVFLKYKTVYVGSKLYTIEDALAMGNCVLVGKDGAYVSTSFTWFRLAGEGFENYSTDLVYDVKNSIELKSSSAPTGGIDKNYPGASHTSVKDAVYSYLVIPEGVTLNVTNNIIVGGVVISPGAVKDRSVIMNNGTINVNSGNVYAFGYIKGTGMLSMASGTMVYDVFRIYDFKGGGITYGIYKSTQKYLPINAYSLHNVSCDTKIYSGSTYYAYYFLSMSSTDFPGTVKVIGKNDTKAMFSLNDGYLVKSADMAASDPARTDTKISNALLTIGGSNQTRGQKDIIKLYGSASDGTVTIQVSLAGNSVTMQTGTDNPLPVSFMDIVVGNDGNGNVGTLNLKNSSYKFMPGSSLTVEEGATLNSDTKVKLLFYSQDECAKAETAVYYAASASTPSAYAYDYMVKMCVDFVDAYLLVNGEANINGSLSGEVKTTTEGALLNVASSSVTITLLNEVKAEAKLLVIVKYADVTLRNPEPTFTGRYKGAYTSIADGAGSYFWTSGDRLVKITYELNGGSGIESKAILLDEIDGALIAHSLTDSDLYTPSKMYHTFVGWYSDKNFSEDKKVTVGSQIDANITLYAKWIPNEYQINYVHVGYIGSLSTITNNNPMSYFYGDSFLFSTPTSSISSMTFLGWFADEDCTRPISGITSTDVGSRTIYALWTDESPITYTVQINGGHSDLSLSLESFKVNGTIESGASFQVPEMNASWGGVNKELNGLYLNDNYNFDSYFGGWILSYTINGVKYTDSYDGQVPTIVIIGGSENILLTPIWKSKLVLSIDFVDTKDNELIAHKEKYFMRSDEAIPMAVLDIIRSKYDEEIDDKFGKDVYFFNNWFVNGVVESSTGQIVMSDDMTIVAQYKRAYHIVIQGDNITTTAREYYVKPSSDRFNITEKITLANNCVIVDVLTSLGKIEKDLGKYYLILDEVDSADDIFVTVYAERGYVIKVVGEGIVEVKGEDVKEGVILLPPKGTSTYFEITINEGSGYFFKDISADSGATVALSGENKYKLDVTNATSKDITVTLDTYHYYKITISTSNASLKVTYTPKGASAPTTITSGQSDWVEHGTIVKYEVTYNSNTNNQKCTVTRDDNQPITPKNNEFTMPESDVTIAASANCFAAGTLIMMADGTQKKVEDLTADDYVLVFNHETGRYELAKILFIDYDGWDYWDIVELNFSNGTKVKVIGEHGFFDLTENKYVYIDAYNYEQYVGHEFATSTWNGHEYVTGRTTLTSVRLYTEYTGCYSPTTVYHLNIVVEGLMSMPGGIQGMFNFFDYDPNTLAYDKEAMQRDIETYGLLPYEFFKDYFSYGVYCMFPAQYVGISLGKGLMTEEYLMYLIERYIDGFDLEGQVENQPDNQSEDVPLPNPQELANPLAAATVPPSTGSSSSGGSSGGSGNDDSNNDES